MANLLEASKLLPNGGHALRQIKAATDEKSGWYSS